MVYLTLENQLLKLSLLCGLSPQSESTHRMQLFLLGNTLLRSKSHQEDYQRAIETGVQKEIWSNDRKLSGQYFITADGYMRGQKLFPEMVPEYYPTTLDQCHFEQVGEINGLSLLIAGRGRGKEIFIDGERARNAKAACEFISAQTGISIPIKGASAFTKLYNLAIDWNFSMRCWFT